MRTLAFTVLAGVGTTVQAVPIHWTDWTSNNSANGFTAEGSITTTTSTVDVTYNNPAGIGFIQTDGGTDYWQNRGGGRDDSTSPYTGSFVDNSPTGSDLIALRYAGTQTLSFSEAIANPIFSYVSLNGNGYAFDQDFDILSFGNASDGNSCGYWGCGTSYKEIVDLGGGLFEYRLLGTGEPHGSLRFTGAFDTVSWRSLSNEYWNGFTVGVQGTAAEIIPNSVPEPGTLVLLGLGLAGVGLKRKKKTIQ
ncbi:PEP-CTERM domain protein [Motiliproteus sp. MSK22-1]|nr:PEP-CTERM domain protein [Motiliproteus sp. MSK22-1]